MLLQRTLRTVATAAELCHTFKFSLDLLSRPPHPLGSLPLRVPFALILNLYILLVTPGLVQGS